MRHQTLAAAAALCVSATLCAQNPADDCANAIAVVAGLNGPFDNTGATPSTPSFVCTTTTTNDIWLSFTPTVSGVHTVSTCNSTGTLNDTLLEVLDGTCGALTSLACNDDACGLKSEVSFYAASGTTYYIRGAGFGGAVGTFDVEITLNGEFSLIGTAEATAGANALGLDGGTFQDNWNLRWNYVDALGTYAGRFAVMTANVGLGGSAPVATTPSIPGLVQVWANSTPAGPDPVFFGPNIVGSGDFSVAIPAGLFNDGDTVRIQGLVLDPASASATTLPVIATNNTIEWSFFRPFVCTVLETFDSTPVGVGSYPTGWANGGGTAQWSTNTGPTNSSNTGPSAGAFSGPNYMYCETSSGGGTATFIMDSAPVASASLPMGTLSMRLSRVGATIGSLDVQMDDGTGTFVTLQNFTGASATGADWDAVSIDLLTASGLAALPTNIVIRFSYTGGGSFTGDVAIDDFCLN